MQFDRHPAFVLHGRPYRETSVLYELLTRDHGRVGAIARGVRGNARRGSARTGSVFFVRCELSGVARGDLVQVRELEPCGMPLLPNAVQSQALLYLNELLVRLLPRHIAFESVFEHYANLLADMPQETDALAWRLRHFECDLLADLGFALTMELEHDGETEVQAKLHYRLVPAQGVFCVGEHARPGSVMGKTLLALARQMTPDRQCTIEAKRLMREWLLHHLDGKPLQSWRVLRTAASPNENLEI